MEFICGLLQEVLAKLESDMKEVSSQDQLMAHLIDELLFFEQELRLTSASDAPSPTVLAVLLESVTFEKWKHLEKACKSRSQ